ncbi:MAG: hypothetical protein A3G70_08465 [Planctomycetes bacterium RIFCSPLOWO2_12_FULL_39_13]|nr:MAG: hypothetical protein A3G70_08465 [Planctomycetes bacterium RIFCSPLOWO2_12_FULL_39_13]
MESIELNIIRIIVTRLSKANIPYMFTGSIAANFYTTPRITRDIDVIIELKGTDVDLLCSLFEADFYVDRDAILNAVEKNGMFNMIHYESVFKVDFIIRKDDKYRLEEFKRRKRITFEDMELYVVAPEDLVLSKLYWAKDSLSELQLGDVKNLIKNVKNIDQEYLELWVKYLDIEELFRKVKE